MAQDRSLKRSRARAPTREGDAALSGWIWGVHASLAALANPEREIQRVVATRNAGARLPPGLAHDLLAPDAIDRLLPPGAVHQGLAVLATPPPPLELEVACTPIDQRPVILLDQITDPQNVGAIFRSAAAFSARAIIMQDRRSPPLTGALAKAAAGAIELVPHVRVVNVARSVAALTEAGYLTVALAGEAEQPLAAAFPDPRPLALVLGAEGKGVRELVRETCERAARIPISPEVESLNVSVAAAVALYEAARRSG